MDTNKNSYTFIFAIVMVIVVAFLLSFAATSLKPLQDANLKQEKMQNILKTVGVDLSREESQVQFVNYIKKGIVVNNEGAVVEEALGADIEKGKAFTANVKAAIQDKQYPIFVAEVEGKTFYVIPLHGMGMWSDIWGNVALESDKNTIAGVNFDHASETAGLGAEIATDWFQKEWVGKQIMKDPNSGFNEANFASVATIKGGAQEGDYHGVDAISGGTVTSTATSKMFKDRVELYLPYFNNLK
ncbi:MAG: NADH:ubiquinone reductase (Na(+)-transporting) subunit C [Bacteroidota bacterium]